MVCCGVGAWRRLKARGGAFAGHASVQHSVAAVLLHVTWRRLCTTPSHSAVHKCPGVRQRTPRCLPAPRRAPRNGGAGALRVGAAVLHRHVHAELAGERRRQRGAARRRRARRRLLPHPGAPLARLPPANIVYKIGLSNTCARSTCVKAHRRVLNAIEQISITFL